MAAWWLVITVLFQLLIFKAAVVWRVRIGAEQVRAPEVPGEMNSCLQPFYSITLLFPQKMQMIDIHHAMNKNSAVYPYIGYYEAITINCWG